MMKNVGIAAGAVVVAVMVGVECDSKISPEEVRSELLEMREADQMARQRLIAGGMTDTVLAAELTRLDSANAAWVKEIVEEIGFPTADMVGRDGMEAFFLVVQHASHDPEFQMRSLPPIQRAAARGELSREAVALLTDRTLLALGKEQVYGT